MQRDKPTAQRDKPRGAIYGPPGFDASGYIRALAHSAFRDFLPQASAWRRDQCRYNPILFALVYLRPTLRKGSKDGVISFSEFHLAAYASALRWTRPGQPYAMRDAWLASRGSGKSSMFFLILAIWALAYGHCRFIVAVSDVASIAREHLESLRTVLEENPRLRQDFPQLCRAKSSNLDKYAARDERGRPVTIVVRGLDSGMAGLKRGDDRPDLILIDDGEGHNSRYSMEKKASRLHTLLSVLLPLDETRTAPVQFVGTTTKWGSILHDILEGKKWALQERFVVHHFPALINDGDPHAERSSWPYKWPLSMLREERARYGFDLNWQCMPGPPGGTFWKPEDICPDPGGRVTKTITRKVLAIDPAMTSTSKSDQTGIALLGYSPKHRRYVVLRAIGVRLDPANLKARVDAMLAADPDIRELVVEKNAGHDFVMAALNPLPAHVTLYARLTVPNKAERFGILLVEYQQSPPRILHAAEFPSLLQQMYTVTGKDELDDIIDSVTLAWEHCQDHPAFIDSAEEHLRRRGAHLS